MTQSKIALKKEGKFHSLSQLSKDNSAFQSPLNLYRMKTCLLLIFLSLHSTYGEEKSSNFVEKHNTLLKWLNFFNDYDSTTTTTPKPETTSSNPETRQPQSVEFPKQDGEKRRDGHMANFNMPQRPARPQNNRQGHPSFPMPMGPSRPQNNRDGHTGFAPPMPGFPAAPFHSNSIP